MNFPVSFPLGEKRIWVTGGNGFLGQQVVRELERRGARPLVTRSAQVDLLAPGAALAFLRAQQPDAVMHLAGTVGGIGANRLNPGRFFFENMAMGLHLIEACRQAAIFKVLVAGTVCSYPADCPVPFREEDLWNGFPEPTNAPYGIAKKALMVQLQAYRQQYGLRGIFLVPVNLYGPGDHLEEGANHVIPALIQKFLKAKASGSPQVVLWGTGAASREFLFVDDAAAGLVDALERYDDPEPVNLGTGREITIQALAQLIQRLVGYPGELVFDPSYPDGQKRRRLDTSRARTRFGWEAQVGLEEGLGRTLAWARPILQP